MRCHFAMGWLITGLMLTLLLPCTIHAEGVYDQVKSDIRAERTEIALKTLRGMVKREPDDFHAWFLYGVASAHLNQYHQAIEAFRHVIALNPELAEPHDNLAVIYNELDDVSAAIRELEQSLVKRPDNPITEENLADLYVKMALKRYRSALDKEPTAQLEKRYMRLLQVRDPDVAPGQQEEVSIESIAVAVEKKRDVVATVTAVEVEKKAPGAAHTGAVISEPVVKEAVAVSPEEGKEDAATQAIKSQEQQLLDAVEAWRSAWASRALADYFGAYADDFQVPERFKSREEWQAYKRYVISSKSYIEIEISDLLVEMQEGDKRARVKFFQKFRSNSYNGAGSKVLEMRLDDGTWKIVREDSVS